MIINPDDTCINTDRWKPSKPPEQIRFLSNCDVQLIETLELDSALGKFAIYSSIIQSIETLVSISRHTGSKISLAVSNNTIIGYLMCRFPEKDERWAHLGELMYEFAGIEVSKSFRALRVAEKLLEITLKDDFFKDKISYMTGFSWHWDLEGTGLNSMQYRQMMLKLFGKFGFREVYTNEPNIALRPENLMMIRLGSRVSEESQKMFRYLRFGLTEML